MHKDELNELFERGVAEFIDPDGQFRKKVEAKVKGEYNKPIVIKLGVDPNKPDIHLGHAVVLRKLRQFQEAGCKVIFLVGDFTARIGDPSGKSKVRPEVEQAEVERNAKTYIEQVGKILRTDDPNLFSWITNADWFTNVTDINLPDDAEMSLEVTIDGKKASASISPNSFVGKAIAYEQSRMQIRVPEAGGKVTAITLSGLLWTLRHITFNKLIARDMFQERIKKGDELYMHEMMYPVLQGLDSLVLAEVYGSCDLEIGGTDQTFNMLIGRDVMKANKKEPQSVMAMEIISGTDGKEKMSKSLDNFIGITETSREMFGKVMSIPDNCLVSYFTLGTYTPLSEIEEIRSKLESGKLHPRDAKLRLAKEIVAIYHGDKEAEAAEKDFISTFSKGGIPQDIETVSAKAGTPLSDILIETKLVKSKSEFQRLEKDGAINEVEPGVYRVGKHRFIKVIFD